MLPYYLLILTDTYWPLTDTFQHLLTLSALLTTYLHLQTLSDIYSHLVMLIDYSLTLRGHILTLADTYQRLLTLSDTKNLILSFDSMNLLILGQMDQNGYPNNLQNTLNNEHSNSRSFFKKSYLQMYITCSDCNLSYSIGSMRYKVWNKLVLAFLVSWPFFFCKTRQSIKV